MRISTRGRYALAAMTLLASRVNEVSISIKDIAKTTGVSEKYLEQLFIQLKRSKLIMGIKGSGGGYRLAKGADKIIAGDVLRAVESSFSLIPCIEAEPCARMSACAARGVWGELQRRINSVVNDITLADLAGDLGGAPKLSAPDYYI